MLCRVLVYGNNLGGFKLIKTPIPFKMKYKRERFTWISNNEKLQNSISRAKSCVYDYAINNNFAYFVTLTFNDRFDDYNLEMIRVKVQQLIRDCRKKYKKDFQFLLIPEKHKKGDWHLHGFFTSDFGLDFYLNEHKYLSWSSFDKYGFSSIDKIRDYKACCKYITKYICKDLALREVGSHLYFCSKGLQKSHRLEDLICNELNCDFDFDCDYCSIKEYDADSIEDLWDMIEDKYYNDYYNYVTDID